uniref:condensation domain-containing protein n=1 Tax=Massilia sp. TSP1-1-2 TaxID=2804649 RepID=UPI003CF380ED
GDVRSLPLLETFHASVQSWQAAGGTPAGQLRERVARQMAMEKELVLSPAYFLDLALRLGRVAHVEVLHKHGHASNELTGYRYDVVLHVGPKQEGAALALDWLDWREAKLDEAGLRALLESQSPTVARLGLARIPNARTVADAALARALQEAGSEVPLARLQEQAADAAQGASQPQALVELARELGWTARLRWSGAQQDETCFDLVLERVGAAPAWIAPRALPAAGWLASNQPLAGQMMEELLPALRTHLQARLPEYAQPGALVLLEWLPTTANGKVDYRRLPAPKGAGSSQERVEPRNALEQELAQIWSQLLRVERIGVHDNFFELGGDSIIAMQVISRLRLAGYEFKPRDLFEAQTIATVALRAVALDPSRADGKAEEQGPFPLAPIQSWFLEQQGTLEPHWNQWLRLPLRAPIAADRFQAACDALVARHAALRTRFDAAQGGRQHVLAASPAVVHAYQLDAGADTDALQKIEQELHAGIDPVHGPVVRFAQIVSGTPAQARCVIVAHHLVVDGVSWRTLVGELEQALAQPDALAGMPRPAAFGQWCRALQGAGDSRGTERDLAFWRRVEGSFGAAGAKAELLGVPTGARGTWGRAQTLIGCLEGARTRALLADETLAARGGMQALLVAGVLRAIAAWNGQQDVLLNLERHGRRVDGAGLEVSGTVGWFTARFPLRLSTGRDLTASDLLMRTARALEMVPVGGVSYGLLRYGTGAIGRQSEPPVGINYLGRFDQMLAGSHHFHADGVASGLSCAPHSPRAQLLEVDALVVGEELEIRWTYDQDHIALAHVEQMAQALLQWLRDAATQSAPTPAVMLAAAPIAGLGADMDDDELRHLLDELESDLD